MPEHRGIPGQQDPHVDALAAQRASIDGRESLAFPGNWELFIASVNWRPGQPSVNDQRRRKTNMLFIPVSAPMRSDPRFSSLTEDIGLAAYWDEAGVAPDHLI
jgi:hypothetical protein